MLLCAVLVLWWGSSKDLRDRVFGDLAGDWWGHCTYSPSDSSNFVDFANYSAVFTIAPGENHIRIVLTNLTSKVESSYFLQKEEEDTSHLLMTNLIGDDLGRLKIASTKKDHCYIIRGILKPKNDQITVSLEVNHLSVAITDQFSSNVTLLSFDQEMRNFFMSQVGKVGIMVTVIICIMVTMYKVANLEGVVTPEEAKTADQIRALSKARDSKKESGEKRKTE
jgi:hypothetical protein